MKCSSIFFFLFVFGRGVGNEMLFFSMFLHHYWNISVHAVKSDVDFLQFLNLHLNFYLCFMRGHGLKKCWSMCMSLWVQMVNVECWIISKIVLKQMNDIKKLAQLSFFFLLSLIHFWKSCYYLELYFSFRKILVLIAAIFRYIHFLSL